MKSHQRKVCQAVALVFATFGASAAMAAAPHLVGGGSSLVAPSIGSEISIFPAADGSLEYHSVGSGAGQAAFLNNDSTQFSLSAGITVHYANSDAPLASSQVASYNSGLATTDGPLIQLPYIVTPIAIPVVAPAGTVATGPALPGSTAATVALNDQDLCGIFSGKINDWNAVINPDNGSAYSTTSKPFKVVYRQEGSGTTDLLTRHLTAVCNANPSWLPAGFTFHETQHYVNSPTVPSTDAIFTSLAAAPANFVAANNSQGVGDQMRTFQSSSTPAIAYLSPDFTNTLLAPSSAPAAMENLTVASVRNRTTNTDVVPTAANATTALASFVPPAGNTAGSAAANPLNWVPNSADPTTGYPISGTSQIIVSQCYKATGTSPTVAQSVVDFLNDHYTNPSFTSIITGNGFNTVPSNYETSIAADFFGGKGTTSTLNIGNATTCASFTGR